MVANCGNYWHDDRYMAPQRCWPFHHLAGLPSRCGCPLLLMFRLRTGFVPLHYESVVLPFSDSVDDWEFRDSCPNDCSGSGPRLPTQLAI